MQLQIYLAKIIQRSSWGGKPNNKAVRCTRARVGTGQRVGKEVQGEGGEAGGVCRF